MGTQNEASWIIGGLLQSVAAQWLWPQGVEFEGSPAPDDAVRFLLDTNVVSEWTKPRPNVGVDQWLVVVDFQSEQQILGELCLGRVNRAFGYLGAELGSTAF